MKLWVYQIKYRFNLPHHAGSGVTSCSTHFSPSQERNGVVAGSADSLPPRSEQGTEASLAPSGLELLLAAVDCIDGTVPSCATKSPFQEDTHNVTCCSDVDSTSP
ncbi:uncharacterized protein LOC119435353 [Dermacentor silvarum]|uniref:uncharacterized protein LOC119435353 n=1 Tax=Dermacentor silvarum TaxID=543639 RepID=UPI00210074E1|nr:uncharacterized protein LOC119435353 [Dermacentor silvarum]